MHLCWMKGDVYPVEAVNDISFSQVLDAHWGVLNDGEVSNYHFFLFLTLVSYYCLLYFNTQAPLIRWLYFGGLWYADYTSLMILSFLCNYEYFMFRYCEFCCNIILCIKFPWLVLTSIPGFDACRQVVFVLTLSQCLLMMFLELILSRVFSRRGYNIQVCTVILFLAESVE